jgi:hypothetical protein
MVSTQKLYFFVLKPYFFGGETKEKKVEKAMVLELEFMVE